MKKNILLFCFALLFLNCSSSDDNLRNSSSINPPSWIQGTWLIEGVTTNSGFRFSNNDFCLVILTGQSCFKEQLNQLNNSGATTKVNEMTANNSYSIDITLSSQIVTYEFKQISATQIEWINDPLGDLAETIYKKQ
ncbi:hypothetical protein [Polaribacter sp.]|uniref:hypothetical protein n=1 Tax=Polaribacter sp. TaxID=1920175 RepID=UPI003EF81630